MRNALTVRVSHASPSGIAAVKAGFDPQWTLRCQASNDRGWPIEEWRVSEGSRGPADIHCRKVFGCCLPVTVFAVGRAARANNHTDRVKTAQTSQILREVTKNAPSREKERGAERPPDATQAALSLRAHLFGLRTSKDPRRRWQPPRNGVSIAACGATNSKLTLHGKCRNVGCLEKTSHSVSHSPSENHRPRQSDSDGVRKGST